MYEALLIAQAGRCAICKRHPDPGRRLCVDHDHKTGRVRALLCDDCNKKLRTLEDDEPGIGAYLAYMERHHGDGWRVIAYAVSDPWW